MRQEVPPEFICPITCDIFNDPVIASDGKTYERSAIQEWTRQAGTSPLTRAPLVPGQFIPNNNLKHAIIHWKNDVKKKSLREGLTQEVTVIIESPLTTGSGVLDSTSSTAFAVEQMIRFTNTSPSPLTTGSGVYGSANHSPFTQVQQQPQQQLQQEEVSPTRAKYVYFTGLILVFILIMWVIIVSIIASSHK